MARLTETRRYRRDALVSYGARVLETTGMPSDVAGHTSAFIVDSDARGYPSHGIDQLPAYWRGLVAGELNAKAQPRIISGRGAVAVLDGDGGLGYETSRIGMNTAIERAREHGIGFVTVRNSNHFGMAAHWPYLAIRKKMIGFATTNGPPVMAPWGGRDPRICNNPLSWGIPAGKELPILFDMACTAAARGKIRIIGQRGEEIPLGWALDLDGEPTTDPEAALAGQLLPVGGHKGSGIAIVNEVLSAALPAGLSLTQVTLSTMSSTGVHERWGIGHSFMAIDVSAFGPRVDFLARVDSMILELKSSHTTKGFDSVRMPGERSLIAESETDELGVPLEAPTQEKLTAFVGECGVEFFNR